MFTLPVWMRVLAEDASEGEGVWMAKVTSMSSWQDNIVRKKMGWDESSYFGRFLLEYSFSACHGELD